MTSNRTDPVKRHQLLRAEEDTMTLHNRVLKDRKSSFSDEEVASSIQAGIKPLRRRGKKPC